MSIILSSASGSTPISPEDISRTTSSPPPTVSTRSLGADDPDGRFRHVDRLGQPADHRGDLRFGVLQQTTVRDDVSSECSDSFPNLPDHRPDGRPPKATARSGRPVDTDGRATTAAHVSTTTVWRQPRTAAATTIPGVVRGSGRSN